jgi:hypothetical protein
MAAFFFIIVLLHLLLGFGWVLYKISFSKKEHPKPNHLPS